MIQTELVDICKGIVLSINAIELEQNIGGGVRSGEQDQGVRNLTFWLCYYWFWPHCRDGGGESTRGGCWRKERGEGDWPKDTAKYSSLRCALVEQSATVPITREIIYQLTNLSYLKY